LASEKLFRFSRAFPIWEHAKHMGKIPLYQLYRQLMN